VPETSTCKGSIADHTARSPKSGSPRWLESVDEWFALWASIQQDEHASASMIAGNGAPSKAGILSGAQQDLFSRLRSACIPLSSLSAATVSRKILAAPELAGTTIL
jgi:hypothetical protein